MEATEVRRRHPFWRRPKTRSFIRLAWPALCAWVLTLVYVELFHARDTAFFVANFWVWAGMFSAAIFFYLLAFAYVFLAAAANAPIKIRLLACAANLSAPILGAIGLKAV